jgi:hypothetical protein
MRRAKREWIYVGLGVPEGAALVRPSGPRPRPARVLLAGGPSAELLRTPLAELAEGALVRLDTAIRRESTASAWLSGGWLAPALVRYAPECVLLSLSIDDGVAAATLGALVSGFGSALVWMPASGPEAPSPSVRAPSAGKLNATATASWAGAAWSAIGS